ANAIAGSRTHRADRSSRRCSDEPMGAGVVFEESARLRGDSRMQKSGAGGGKRESGGAGGLTNFIFVRPAPAAGRIVRADATSPPGRIFPEANGDRNTKAPRPVPGVGSVRGPPYR